MGYLIGAGPLDPAVKRYNGGTSSFTMDNSGTTNGTLLWVDGVAQVPGTDYNVSGTTITTTTAAGAGTNNVTSLQLFNTGLITTPADNTVAIAKIQDDAVTLAKMAAGTDGNLISYDTSGNPVAVATGSDGQVLTSSGAGAVCAFEDAGGGITLGTEVASTSGTAIEFTSIASTAKRITINMVGVSHGSASQTLQLQLSDSGGYETSGYTSVVHGLDDEAVQTTQRATAHYILYHITGMQAADVADGVIVLTLEDATNNQWNCTSHVGMTNADNIGMQVGTKALSGELTAFKIFTSGGATFDAGAVNIMVE